MLIEKINNKEARIGVIGLGYVGLPLTLAFGKARFSITGLDIDTKKTEQLMEGKSYIKHISSEDIRALESKALSHSEVFHISCSGETSWFGFAKKILKLSSLSKNTELVPIPTTQYPTPAIRPQKSLLSNKKLKHSFNYEISHWQDALQKCLAGASN